MSQDICEQPQKNSCRTHGCFSHQLSPLPTLASSKLQKPILFIYLIAMSFKGVQVPTWSQRLKVH